jgi:BASS family bile acid:Na+ symporter
VETTSESLDAVRLNFEGNGLWVLNIIIGLIMFGVALDLRVGDFLNIAKKPKGPLIGLFAQFILLPAVSFLITVILRPAPSVALGMILIAACPGGNLSNFLTALSKGNAAMSVTMTAISTVVAVFFTPLNLAVWGSLNPATAKILTAIEMETSDLFQTILIILGIPTALGMMFGYLFPALARRMITPFKIFSIVAFLTFVGIAFSKNFDVFRHYIHWVLLAVFLQNGAALAIGYFSAYASGLSEADRRAIAIEVGIQNSALGLVLVFRYFDGLGGMALVAGWWGIWHVISGLTLATIWSRRAPTSTYDAIEVAKA